MRTIQMYLCENRNVNDRSYADRLNDPVLQSARGITRAVPEPKEKWKAPSGRVYGDKRKSLLAKIEEKENEIFYLKVEIEGLQKSLKTLYKSGPSDGRTAKIKDVGEMIGDNQALIASLLNDIETIGTKLQI